MVKTKVIELEGGVNEDKPNLQMNPGNIIQCTNYVIAEGINGGYSSVKGYERMDGGILPSEVVINVLRFVDNGTRLILAGDTITGATGEVTAVGDGVLNSTTGYQTVEVTVVTNDFTTAEDIYVGAEMIGEYRGILSTTSSEDHHVAYDARLAATLPVGGANGQGPVLGISLFQGQLYAFRRKVDEPTQVGMYAGDGLWTEIDTSGDPILYDADMSFEFITYNFYGGTVLADAYSKGSIESLFWVDGHNEARQFNTTQGVQVLHNTGMTEYGQTDAPTHIMARGSYLFLAYRGGSLQYSGVGRPDLWSALDGAGEIGMGKEITGLQVGVGDALIVFMVNGISVITGGPIDQWQTKVHSRESGAFDGSIQRMLGTIFFLDDRGLTTMEAVDTFGDFGANSISAKFKSTLLANIENLTTSTIKRDSNQYRVYFNNGLGITVSFEGKEMRGATYTEYPITVDKITEGDYGAGKGDIYFTSDVASVIQTGDVSTNIEGYVYKMDSGASFDGFEIITKINTTYYHYNTPRRWKRFIGCRVESNTPSNIDYSFKINYDYMSNVLPSTSWITGSTDSLVTDLSLYGSSIYGVDRYGVSPETFSQPIYLLGYGTNASFQWITSEKWAKPHSVQNIIVDYEVLGRQI